MLVTRNLGDSANTTALSTFSVGNLDSVYVTIDGTFSATGTVEVSFNGGTTWEAYGSSTTAKKLIGPLPGATLVRGKNSARASGTVSYRLGGNAKRYRGFNSRTKREGLFANITSDTPATAVSVTGLEDVTVWLKSADFVGTYEVQISFDGGTTWGIYATATVASGATSALVTPCRATHLRVVASTFTSGTLSCRWAGFVESQL